MDLFSRFFRENQEKFLAFAYSYIRSWAEAEDILMESMISLWECRDRWEEDKGLHALLLTIIKNKALNYLEHEQTRLRIEEDLNSHRQRELDLRIATLKDCEPDKIFQYGDTAYRKQSLGQDATTKSRNLYAQPL